MLNENKEFILNAWYVAAYSSELTKESMLSRKLLGEQILLWRPEAGGVTALTDRCPHRLVPLSAGKRNANSIQCLYHGMEFDQAGSCIRIPGQDTIPEQASVASWPVIERHGFIWIWMGVTDLADSELIPNIPWMEMPGWRPAFGHHVVKAHFGLVTDNLLDLSHVSYVHERTIGNAADESVANFPVEISVNENSVIKAHREMQNIEAPPFFAMVLGGPGRINRWQTGVWAPPCLNITDTGVYYVNDEVADAFKGRALHILTPETGGSTHYFWILARNYRLEDENLTKAMLKEVKQTVEEDIYLLELQQQQIVETSQTVPAFATKLDNAPLRARRIHQSLLRREMEHPNLVVPVVSLDLD